MLSDKLESNLKNVLYSSLLEVITVDIFNDQVCIYKLNNGAFNNTSKESVTNYLENLKVNIEDEFINGLMNLFSMPKLKEELKNKDKVNFKYKTINNKWYKITSLIINEDDIEKILVVKEELEGEEKVDNSDDNSRYNSLVSRLADSILKINNIFSLNSRNTNLKNVEEYINTMLNNLVNSYPELKKSLNNTFINVSGRKDDVLLIVDDDALTRGMIKKIFKDEYKIVELKNGKEALEYLDSNSKKGINEASDNILGIFLDLTMPVLDGFHVLDYLSKNNYLNRIPVIIISGDYEKETKQRVYNYRIADMLEKPFDFEIVKHRISNFIKLYRSSNSLANIINDEERNLKEIINSYVDSYLYDYSENIKNIENYINAFGNKILDKYPEYEFDIEKLKDASKYYDIGFYSIPRNVLKKEKLEKDDIDIIKNYPLFGEKMLNYILKDISDSQYKKYASNITLYHHENYNGTGYPNGLKEDNIPLETQIASICIYYNNLKSKGASNINKILMDKKNTMFNPKLIDLFIENIDEIDNI